MTNNDSIAAAALSAVLTEANAQVCRSCGVRAAVRVNPRAIVRAEPFATPNPVWFCFECGHEEPAVD
jgi:hypothetical protein